MFHSPKMRLVNIEVYVGRTVLYIYTRQLINSIVKCLNLCYVSPPTTTAWHVIE